jgi:divalent metal cation (Fe/Co/Zn/Cd) transporter
VVSIPQIATNAVRRIQRVQAITIVWMSAEAAVSLFAAWRAQSPALLAFGGDSAIELASAVVVLWRFHAIAAQEHAERRAASVAGVLLFVLAACVVATSVMALLGYSEPKPTFLGLAILVAAAVVMPSLAKEKRRLSRATDSAALKADAVQSMLCAYLSLIAVTGLVINAIWHIKCADPIAALAVLPLILREGWEPCAGRPATAESKRRRCPILSSDLTARWRNDAVHADVYDQLAVMVGDVPQSRVQHFKPIVARVWAFHGGH